MIYDIMIVGAGPAGMTAALYGARAGRSVLLLERGIPGGQILESQKIENYPACPDVDGYTFSDNLRRQVESFGVRVETGEASAIEKQGDGSFVLMVGMSSYVGKTVILATGLKHRHLEIPGEKELIGRGVSFCATCDGMFFRGREVAVVGGGNTAVQDALLLSEYCSRVYLIHRRDTLRAERHLSERMQKKENIEFVKETVVKEILGQEKLEGLRLCSVRTNEVREFLVSALFEAVGQLPQNAPFAPLAPMNEEGYLLADEQCRTSVSGLFVAGDAREKQVRQLTTAVSDGTLAALSAVSYLEQMYEN